MTEHLIVIDFTNPEAIEDLVDLKSYLENQEYIAYDTETTGLGKDAEIIGFSVSSEVDLGFYIVLSYWDTSNKKLIYCDSQFKDAALDILRLISTKNLIMHNAVFDIEKTVDNFGIDLMPALHTDTMIMAHLLNENERIGLKDLGAGIFGEDAKKEQIEMKASIIQNGGACDSKNFELYKADKQLIGSYAAKDAVLTIKLFYHLVPKLVEENLDAFFWDDESMPLLKGPTYELNTVGLKVDIDGLKNLEKDLIDESVRLKAEVLQDIWPYIKDKYPGTNKANTFNIAAPKQLAWLIFIRLNEEFRKLTDSGREVAKDLLGKLPYTTAQKRAFIRSVEENGQKPWNYLQCDKATLSKLSLKYDWIRKLLEYRKACKLLSTYVLGIQDKTRYGVIRPSFLQAGTTGTRYSSRAPNFQNLPRDDKRIKSCIVSRPGKVFVGADYSQLEPRVFTAMSQDPILLEAYSNGEDFYSALAIPIFGKYEFSAMKDADNYLGKKDPVTRQLGKECALSLAYGATPYRLNETLITKANLDLPIERCIEIRNDYFDRLSGVAAFVNESRRLVVENGVVVNLFGRPRRIPQAMALKNILKSVDVSELRYDQRACINLAVNYRVQGTAGSVVNRACIAFSRRCKELGLDAKIVLQVHDEIIVECPEEQASEVSALLKDCMENTVQLPGVALVADPKIARNLGDLK